MDPSWAAKIIGFPRSYLRNLGPRPTTFGVPFIDSELGRLCALRIPESQNAQTAQKTIQDIQMYLSMLDEQAGRQDWLKWSQKPRLYAILRNIGAVEYIDAFIHAGYTDFHLPFDQRTLPAMLDDKGDRNFREAFIEHQVHYLTMAKTIERGEGQHWLLPPHTCGDDYFAPEKPLGHGSFGEVDLVFSRLSTQRYARKRVMRVRSDRSRENQSVIVNELQALKQLRHTHLIRIVGSYTDKEYIAYIMKPVAECTLAQFLSRPMRLDQSEQVVLRRFYGCLAGAVNYLHQNRIRHRDLTARNVLVWRNEVYISDFGSAYDWRNKPGSMTRHRNTPVSPDYMAPEVARDEERGTPSDMWSLGVVYLEMTTKLLGHRIKELRASLQEHARQQKSSAYPYANLPAVSSWIKRLGRVDTEDDYDKEPLAWIRGLLDVKPENRPSSLVLMQDILESPSFGTFCCLKCQSAYQDDQPYDMLTERSGAIVDSHDTTAKVETFMNEIQARSSHGIMSEKRLDSIRDWISETPGATTDQFEVKDEINDQWQPEVDTERDDGGTRFTDRLLYASYEANYYMSNTAKEPDPTQWDHPDEEYSIPGTFPADELSTRPETTIQAPELEGQKQTSRDIIELRKLKDSGLGFLEHESVCSEDEDNGIKPYEEVSDRSTTCSDDPDPNTHPQPVGDFLFDGKLTALQSEDEDEDIIGQNDDVFRNKNAQQLFGEAEDASEDDDDLLREVSDKSDDDVSEKGASMANEPRRMSPPKTMPDVPNEPAQPVEGLVHEADDTVEPGELLRTKAVAPSATRMKLFEMDSVLKRLKGDDDAQVCELPLVIENDGTVLEAVQSPIKQRHSQVGQTLAVEEVPINDDYFLSEAKADKLTGVALQQKGEGTVSVEFAETFERVELSTADSKPQAALEPDAGSPPQGAETPQDSNLHTEQQIPEDQSTPKETNGSTGTKVDSREWVRIEEYWETEPIIPVPPQVIPEEVSPVLPVGKIQDPPHASENIPEKSFKPHKLPSNVGSSNAKSKGKAKKKVSIAEEPNTIPPEAPFTGEKQRSKSSGIRVEQPTDRFSRRQPPTRGELPDIDAKQLMRDTWDLASSAPTSVVSAATKSKLTQFFFMIPHINQIQSALTEYCRMGKASAVKVMIDVIASRRISSDFYRKPVWACMKGATGRHTKCLRVLIEAGAGINIKNKGEGKTPLHIAVEHSDFKGYTNLIWLLISKDADPNIKDSSGDSPLMKLFTGNAAEPLMKHQLSALAILLQGGAKVDAIQSGTGQTPLHLAVRRQDKWAAAMLIHKKADVNIKTNYGTTPLSTTANQFRGDLNDDHAQVLDLLLRHGAEVNERSGVEKRTALHLAVTSGTARAVEMLLRYKADPEICNASGEDARRLAVKSAAKLTQDSSKVYDRRIDDHVEIMERLFGDKVKWLMTEGGCPVEQAITQGGALGAVLLRRMIDVGMNIDAKFGDKGTIAELVAKKGGSFAKAVLQHARAEKEAGATSK